MSNSAICILAALLSSMMIPTYARGSVDVYNDIEMKTHNRKDNLSVRPASKIAKDLAGISSGQHDVQLKSVNYDATKSNEVNLSEIAHLRERRQTRYNEVYTPVQGTGKERPKGHSSPIDLTPARPARPPNVTPPPVNHGKGSSSHTTTTKRPPSFNTEMNSQPSRPVNTANRPSIAYLPSNSNGNYPQNNNRPVYQMNRPNRVTTTTNADPQRNQNLWPQSNYNYQTAQANYYQIQQANNYQPPQTNVQYNPQNNNQNPYLSLPAWSQPNFASRFSSPDPDTSENNLPPRYDKYNTYHADPNKKTFDLYNTERIPTHQFHQGSIPEIKYSYQRRSQSKHRLGCPHESRVSYRGDYSDTIYFPVN